MRIKFRSGNSKYNYVNLYIVYLSITYIMTDAKPSRYINRQV